MNRKYSIGILGGGFVGKAVFNGFKEVAEIRIFDLKDELRTHSFEDTIDSDFIYICLPTPMTDVEGGKINLSIINNAIEKIDSLVKDKIIITKSTVVPGTTERLSEKYTNNYFLNNPEFLTANNANEDFRNPYRILIGKAKRTPEEILNKFKELQKLVFEEIPIVISDCNTTEFIKYMNNCFLASKIVLLNEFYLMGKKFDVDWKKAIEGFLLDKRIGKSHYKVPGGDNSFGFGGFCFPKDINALIHKAEEAGFDAKVLKSVWEQNKEIRKKENWDWANNESSVKKD